MLRLSLMLVVFVDVMGQGLILPIINTLLIDPSSTFLPHDTPRHTRQMMYGWLAGIFYIFWFFGAAYISKLSDYIGRKKGMVICLVGALAGYILTAIAIELSNYYLLLLGRAITGFTAGNQPIAQAALIDISKDDKELTRNMSKIVAALALGLIAGPLIAGVLSDSSLIGSYATLELPFYFAAGLVFITLLSVQVFYHDSVNVYRKIDFGVNEVFLNLWRLRGRTTIIKISIVWFLFEIGLNSFFIFINNYTIERFQFSTQQNSILMIVIGLSMALSSKILAEPITSKFKKIPTITGAILLMAVSICIYIFNDSPLFAYLLAIPILVAFGIGYPVMLTLFSASANKDEQGWVMGVSIALFTLGSGLISILGGMLMALNVNLPFAVGIASFIAALVFIAILWRQSDIQALDN